MNLRKEEGGRLFLGYILLSRKHVKHVVLLYWRKETTMFVSGTWCDSWCYSTLMHPLFVRRTTRYSLHHCTTFAFLDLEQRWYWQHAGSTAHSGVEVGLWMPHGKGLLLNLEFRIWLDISAASKQMIIMWMWLSIIVTMLWKSATCSSSLLLLVDRPIAISSSFQDPTSLPYANAISSTIIELHNKVYYSLSYTT